MLEIQHGIPTASIQTDAFETAVKQSAFANGLPDQRFVFVPQPVMGKPPAELRAYVDGDDPVTGRAVMVEVVEALTGPLTDAENHEHLGRLLYSCCDWPIPGGGSVPIARKRPQICGLRKRV